MFGEYAWVWENEYLRAAIILLGSVIVAKVFQVFLIAFFKRLTKKTETDIDDLILKFSARPIFYLIILIGVWFSVRPLSILEPHARTRDGVFFVLTVFVISWIISRVFVLVTTRWFVSHRNLKDSPKLVNIIVSSTIYLAAGIVILSYFNIQITPLVAALGVGGLAVGLALQDTLGNVFAGIHIISDQPIRVKDIVEIQGQNVAGEVVDIGWRSTRIKTFKGNSVIVPNSTIANSILTNYELPHQPMRVVVECGVDYGTDLYKVEEVAIEVAEEIQKNLDSATDDFEPIFRYHAFGDSNINFRVILEGKSRGDTFLVVNEYIKALHARFDKEGIEISWPIRKQYQLGKPKGKKVYKKKPKQKKKSKKKATKKEKKDLLAGSIED